MMIKKNFLADIGAKTLGMLVESGKLAIFVSKGVWACFSPPVYCGEMLKQILHTGFFSIPIVGLTAVFSGMVIALQTYVGFAKFSGESAVATVVIVAITRELGPVMAGLMVAGRISASIAAELGSMKISEQIDALEVLGVSPFRFLVAPRIWACLISLPLLTVLADIIGTFGGFVVGTTKLGFSSHAYMTQTFANLKMEDVICGLVKSACFGFVIAAFGCFYGFNSLRGAKSVGEATTMAVVAACMGVLVLNYIVTSLFFGA
ncbi:MAG: ABC transporter permease [Holosporales bacterium]|jgi:phospholipid/cholesterol/gamma-HCH transport system permease protein|nr:ABC transporter permease [Holosporales bacterium]